MGTMVELNKVLRVYPGAAEIRALDDVSLSIKQGAFAVVHGPSGSGKSTLLNCIGGIDQPDQGQVWVANQEIGRLKRKQLAAFRCRTVGYVFQEFLLVPVLTVAQNVALPLQLLGRSGSEIRPQVEDMLKQVGLEGTGKRFPAELSGGQQQRVAIARALIKGAELLLADEPTAHLDSATGEDIIKLMFQLNRQSGTTFLLSSHDPMVIKASPERIKLCDGRIIEHS